MLNHHAQHVCVEAWTFRDLFLHSLSVLKLHDQRQVFFIAWLHASKSYNLLTAPQSWSPHSKGAQQLIHKLHNML